ANRLGASSMPDIQVFGRRAGLAAAEETRASRRAAAESALRWAQRRATELERPLGRDGGVSPPALKREVQELSTANVGLVRSGAGLEQTREKLAEYRQDAVPRLAAPGGTRVLNRGWMETIELRNMLDVVSAMSAAALARTETR